MEQNELTFRTWRAQIIKFRLVEKSHNCNGSNVLGISPDILWTHVGFKIFTFFFLFVFVKVIFSKI